MFAAGSVLVKSGLAGKVIESIITSKAKREQTGSHIPVVGIQLLAGEGKSKIYGVRTPMS